MKLAQMDYYSIFAFAFTLQATTAAPANAHQNTQIWNPVHVVLKLDAWTTRRMSKLSKLS